MSILAIAYTWMIRIGMWVKKVRPRIFKKKVTWSPGEAHSLRRIGFYPQLGFQTDAEMDEIFVMYSDEI